MPSINPGTAGFPNGVAAGDVTDSGATLWTRTSAETPVQLDVYDAVYPPNAVLAVPGATVFTASSSTAAADDDTTKVQVSGLAPHTTYFYRFTNGAEQSQLGRFVTAPAPDQAASFRFVVAADADGFPVGGPPAFNNFEVLERARLDQPDFFSFLGDTIYSDSSFAPGPVTTVDQYRDADEQNRSFANLRNLMSATGTYAQIDDHEVYNDFDGETVDPTRYAAGLRAFNDWMPTNTTNVLTDATCAGGHPRYFHQKWGTQAEVFQLDERSCRSSQDPVKAACMNPGPSLDLAPTAPTGAAPLRGTSGGPHRPDASPRSTIRRARFLGPVQKAAFEADLAASTAKFKIVLSEDAIQQFYALPYDRWEGYGADRTEILNAIRDNHISNVVFLTTDLHANIANNVFIDKTADPDPIAYEAISGPIATNTYKHEILNSFPANGEALVNSLQAVLSLQGVECRAIDTYSYQLVEVNAGAGTLTISSRDKDGHVLSDDLDPADEVHEDARSVTVAPSPHAPRRDQLTPRCAICRHAASLLCADGWTGGGRRGRRWRGGRDRVRARDARARGPGHDLQPRRHRGARASRSTSCTPARCCRASRCGAGSMDEIEREDILVITAGHHTKPGESRLDVLHKNVAVMDSVATAVEAGALPRVAHRRHQPARRDDRVPHPPLAGPRRSR